MSYAKQNAWTRHGIPVAHLYARRLLLCRGPELTLPKFFPLVLTAVSALTIAARPGDAQVVYPLPPYRVAVLDSSVRFDVTPQQAEVFVDGYYAGIVDDFDGMFQRLRVEPGQHEITLYLEGYRTERQRLYLVRDRTTRIALHLQPLTPGEVGEARPVPTSPPMIIQPTRPLPRDPLPPGAVQPPELQAPASGQASTGRLAVLVQPADASVVIDGQPWPASPGQEATVLDLPEGRHVIQVRRPGYVGYLTVSGNRIAVGAIALIGIGVMGAIVKTRQKEPS
jgi:hypothetical protein